MLIMPAIPARVKMTRLDPDQPSPVFDLSFNRLEEPEPVEDSCEFGLWEGSSRLDQGRCPLETGVLPRAGPAEGQCARPGRRDPRSRGFTAQSLEKPSPSAAGRSTSYASPFCGRGGAAHLRACGGRGVFVTLVFHPVMRRVRYEAGFFRTA